MGIQLITWNDKESKYDNVDISSNVYGAVFVLESGKEITISHATRQDHSNDGIVIRSTHGALGVMPKVANTIVIEVL